MPSMKELAGLLKNDPAKARVQRLNKAGREAVQSADDGDGKLAAYKKYVKKFYEFKEKYPTWTDRLDSPIEYSRFVEDYNEEMFKTIAKSAEDYKGKGPEEVYMLKMHGINLRSIEVLKEKLGELLPGSEWTDPNYFDLHIREAYQLLRQYYPSDEEYDNIFSPKETMLFWD